MHFFVQVAFGILCPPLCWLTLASSFRTHVCHNCSFKATTMFYISKMLQFLRLFAIYKPVFFMFRSCRLPIFFTFLIHYIPIFCMQHSVSFSVCEIVHDPHQHVATENTCCHYFYFDLFVFCQILKCTLYNERIIQRKGPSSITLTV